ncbi:hypothetical protein D9H45_26700 [Escherichia coli]|nr:hypothetical protein [Escherichia coli]MGQ76307.1 hypothetical protein [Escherichia coli]
MWGRGRSVTDIFRIPVKKERNMQIPCISICLASAYDRHTHISHICISITYTYVSHLHILNIYKSHLARRKT